ncbi:MAG: cytidylyltransferase domain-containing protein [Opitutales bacterium]
MASSSKPVRNAVVVTAKGGNTTVQNKNAIPILGVPVVLYPVRAAKLSVLTDAVYMSTEDRMLRTLALKEDIGIIERPAELARSDSLHADVIRHAVQELERMHPELENVIVLLGNTVQVTPALIDRGFAALDEGDCDSVASVWRAQDDHPYRALKVNEEGFAESFLEVECGSNRQSYPSVFYYDQGIWAFKKECAIDQKGPVPWTWLGQRCKLIERPWVTGRDIHTWIDISASAWYLNAIQVNDYMDYKDL